MLCVFQACVIWSVFSVFCFTRVAGASRLLLRALRARCGRFARTRTTPASPGWALRARCRCFAPAAGAARLLRPLRARCGPFAPACGCFTAEEIVFEPSVDFYHFNGIPSSSANAIWEISKNTLTVSYQSSDENVACPGWFCPAKNTHAHLYSIGVPFQWDTPI